MAKTVSEGELCANVDSLLDGVRERRAHGLVSRDGVPIAALVPVDYVAVYEETLEILSDRKARSALDQGLAEIARGEMVTFDEVRAELRAVRARTGRTSRSQPDEAD